MIDHRRLQWPRARSTTPSTRPWTIVSKTLRHSRMKSKGCKVRHFWPINLRYILTYNCDIEFFIFRFCQVWNFQILNQSKQDQNLAEQLWNCQMRKRRLTNCNKIGWNQRFKLWNFDWCHEFYVKFETPCFSWTNVMKLFLSVMYEFL
jgi:hypothetical protein